MKKLKEVNIGDKFGSWTVISKSDKTDSSHNKYYTCKCECGTIREIVRNKLTSGHTKSCGCKRKKDMTGKVVKDLLFIEPVRAETSGRMVWKCKCLKCGRTTTSEDTIRKKKPQQQGKQQKKKCSGR